MRGPQSVQTGSGFNLPQISAVADRSSFWFCSFIGFCPCKFLLLQIAAYTARVSTPCKFLLSQITRYNKPPIQTPIPSRKGRLELLPFSGDGLFVHFPLATAALSFSLWRRKKEEAVAEMRRLLLLISGSGSCQISLSCLAFMLVEALSPE